MIDPAAIYTADFEDAGPHPVIVVSRPALNRGRYAVVVVCTSARFQQQRLLPNCVPFFAGEYGFTTDCVAQCENILSVELSRLDLDRGPRGMLDPARFRDVIKAIGHVLGSDCEPA